MKCQILFSWKNINLSSAELAQRVVKVKDKQEDFFLLQPSNT